jgi:hypothetical protein
MFQNQLSAGSPNTYLYTKSSASLELGPFLKTFVNRSTQLEASLYFRPQVSYLYPTQNGAAGGIRAKITSQTVKKLLNPGWNLVLERTNAAGTDFNSMTYGTGISNLMRFSSQDTLTASIDVLLTNYFESSNHRKDVNLPLRISWSRFLTAQWTLMCDFNYITNLSTVSATYSYNRLLAGLGIAWAI